MCAGRQLTQRAGLFQIVPANTRAKLASTYDETGFATSCAASPAVAALFQGPDPVQTFQSAHLFPGNGLESAAHAPYRSAPAAGLPQAHPRPGGRHLDRSRVVPDPV